jgi:osmotically-inducible protein OsmY
MTDQPTPSMTDAQLADNVRQAIYLDERLSEQPIKVSVQDAVVRLEGTLQSHRRRLAAVEIANSFVGCLSVDDRLEVDPPADLPDDEVADNVRAALATHPDIGKSTISVAVEAGGVTLSGNVRTQWERIEAEDVALGAEGVRSVDNLLLLDMPGQFEDREIGRTIKSELIKELGPAAQSIRVAFAADTAVLSGSVSDAWHRQKADEIARRCRVVHLRNEIQVKEEGR